MTTTRNQAFAALFALTDGLALPGDTPALVSRSRKFKHFDKVPTDQQPALFQTEHSETQTEATNMRPRRKWMAHWTLYVSSDPGDPDEQAAAWLNDYLDAFDAAIAPPKGQPTQTLGGLVHHAFIDGAIIKVPGDDDGQGMLAVPLAILVP